MIEQIQWIPTADRLPDDNTTVLIIVKNATEPCWPGYIDGGLWFYADGILIINDRPAYWAHLPGGPGYELIIEKFVIDDGQEDEFEDDEEPGEEYGQLIHEKTMKCTQGDYLWNI